MKHTPGHDTELGSVAGDRYTSLEQRVDAAARRLLGSHRAEGWRGFVVEFLAFGAKQAWACVFGAAMLSLIVLSALFYPDHAALARNDFLVLAAVAVQAIMLLTRLETGREVWVIVLFHVAGTAMELFKTSIGSWSYPPGGVLHLGHVPLYSGFMYASVGSYMVRVYRLFDLRFERYPPRWLTAVVSAAIYANFFTHHWLPDARWVLLVLVAIVWARTMMHFSVFRTAPRMPLLVAFGLVAFFIWVAENIATAGGAWFYPTQADGWTMVPITKWVAWFLLMIISVVLVTLVYPPRSPSDQQHPAADTTSR